MSAPQAGLRVLAESSQVYKVVDGSHFAHTSGICNLHKVQLCRAVDGRYKLLCYLLSRPGAPPEVVDITPDHQLEPPGGVEQVVREPFTIKGDAQSVNEVISEGEFGGEDALLWNFQLKRDTATSMLQRLGLRGGRHPVVRLCFEEQTDAQNWYALLSLVLGVNSADAQRFISGSSSSDMLHEAARAIQDTTGAVAAATP